MELADAAISDPTRTELECRPKQKNPSAHLITAMEGIYVKDPMYAISCLGESRFAMPISAEFRGQPEDIRFVYAWFWLPWSISSVNE